MKNAAALLPCAVLALALTGPLRAAGPTARATAPRLAPATLHPENEYRGEVVVLLHGLGLNRLAMLRLECALQHAGYRVVNVSYPSTRLPLERLATEWLPGQLSAHRLEDARRIHFVTHSMGGILLRCHLQTATLPNLGRIVMLAPPNQGSEVVDHLRDNPLFRLFTGKNGVRLGTDSDSLPRQLGPLGGELGIIAGDRSLNPLFSHWIGSPNDGKVSVASTRLPGMRDHLVVPISHTWLQWRSPVIAQVKHFLRDGHFQHPPAST